jgi:hypothetical protein
MVVATKVHEARAGETVNWWGDDREVAPTCKEESGSWYCATHQDSFRGNWLITSHTDDGKKHVIVWVCSEHGPEDSGVVS